MSARSQLRCAIYTRVSTDHRLEQDFNSLDNQREAAEAYVKSQAHEGWKPVRDTYDDGGFSGGSLERPALQRLLVEIKAKRVDIVVPAVIVTGLSPAKKRALALADNKIAEKAGWDREALAIELPTIAELLIEDDIDISITGFGSIEIESIVSDFSEVATAEDDIDPSWAGATAVTRAGDMWQLGSHRLLCGSALDAADLDQLMGSERARVAFLDPPYNLEVASFVGRGRIKHREFAMASGEMSRARFQSFLAGALELAASVSIEGAVHYVCMDWRHVADLVGAGERAYGSMLNLVVWTKTNAGQGAFYRSQHEMIGVFRVGRGQHVNNVELGRHGQNRSNVWRYAGVNSFGSVRLAELESHPTVKPVGMIADALKDCSRRGDIVLDTFCGSGSTMMAAEKVGRRCYGIELDPRYVDTAIRRWQSATGRDAVRAGTADTFDEAAAEAQHRCGGQGDE